MTVRFASCTTRAFSVGRTTEIDAMNPQGPA
jgi:hypothetical protein